MGRISNETFFINDPIILKKFKAPNGDICNDFKEAFDKFCRSKERCEYCDLRSADCLVMERVAYRYSYPNGVAKRKVEEFCRLTGYKLLDE